MSRPRRPWRPPALLVAVLALPSPATVGRAAEGSPPGAPRDAAEKVQEGNVKNWIEYYQRTRPPPPKAAADGTGSAPWPPAGTPKPDTGASRPE